MVTSFHARFGSDGVDTCTQCGDELYANVSRRRRNRIHGRSASGPVTCHTALVRHRLALEYTACSNKTPLSLVSRKMCYWAPVYDLAKYNPSCSLVRPGPGLWPLFLFSFILFAIHYRAKSLTNYLTNSNMGAATRVHIWAASSPVYTNFVSFHAPLAFLWYFAEKKYERWTRRYYFRGCN